MKKEFNEKTFTMLAINYVIGFGFIATIVNVVELGYWGVLIFAITAFLAITTALAFSRLVNAFPEDKGGSVAYAQRTNKKYLTFFTLFNQYIQSPLLSASGPLFLVKIAEVLNADETVLWIVRIISIVFFLVIIVISTFTLKTSKVLIFASAAIKWSILALGFGGLIYLVFVNPGSQSNIIEDTKKINAYLIFSNIILFMFAFGGIEVVPNLANEVKFKNFKKVMMLAFMVIIAIYVLGYILFINVDLKENGSFVKIYKNSMGTFGVVAFSGYIIFYNFSSTLTSSISYPKALVKFAEDGYLPKYLTKTNKHNQHKNAIWTHAVLIMMSMTIFTLIPTIFNLDGQAFDFVATVGTIAFLLQYVLTYVSALVLSKQKKITKIPIYEKIMYYVAALIIIVSTLIYFFPFLVNEKWTNQNTLALVSYLGFFALANIFYYSYRYKDTIKNHFIKAKKTK
ncbi:APC family permease [Mycoplasmopsis ciconiae]|uniref:APC family permease n=1 Tax=Mycoplasmopsis ciconiae TaxID=561067 RepID=A0ABU7MM34_9BACT|nr:APC family permease [Mycoplasmopsis ciconiae]